MANCYQAIEHNLEIVAVLNKIDLPAADPERCAEELERVLGIARRAILQISAKTGEGVPELLRAVIERMPAPTGDPDAPLQALIFDSYYDQYRGVVSSIRIVDGTLRADARCGCCRPARSTRSKRSGSARPMPVPSTRSDPARSATSSPASRTSGRRVPARR